MHNLTKLLAFTKHKAAICVKLTAKRFYIKVLSETHLYSNQCFT